MNDHASLEVLDATGEAEEDSVKKPPADAEEDQEPRWVQ